MEHASSWGMWLAYGTIVAFLLLVLAVFLRTMMLFSTLTFMPLARIARQIERLFGRRRP
jgi:hypothetical protein